MISNEKMSGKKIMNDKGYVMSLTSFLLILPVFLMLLVFINMTVGQADLQQSVLTSEDVLGVTKDLETNIPRIGREVIKDKSEEVIKSGIPLSDSRKSIRDEIQSRMDIWCSRYNYEGIRTDCDILYVDNSQDPFQIEVKSKIKVEKGELKHQENLTQNISLINDSFPIMDPLPFVKCREHGGATIRGNRIFYGYSLSNYLESRGINNSEAYENATSPLYIRKCPYDPYELHGSSQDLMNLKNCLDNGFYHESSDGSCFLCRLEGKGVCPHYGMETFILPAPSENLSYLNNSSATATSAPDHVIFDDTGHGTYPGHMIVYFNNGTHYFYLYLDDSHRKKYGLPLFGD
ncbi:MAG: hypothetical protein A4E25_01847 [Methanobacterium sp. PtaB.Bin024]|nr:MAG: hypothetical protein A4E25_01847 [Methanobacterium sp. PtaB.Bin024]